MLNLLLNTEFIQTIFGIGYQSLFRLYTGNYRYITVNRSIMPYLVLV
jgi:hypothetical protein